MPLLLNQGEIQDKADFLSSQNNHDDKTNATTTEENFENRQDNAIESVHLSPLYSVTENRKSFGTLYHKQYDFENSY